MQCLKPGIHWGKNECMNVWNLQNSRWECLLLERLVRMPISEDPSSKFHDSKQTRANKNGAFVVLSIMASHTHTLCNTCAYVSLCLFIPLNSVQQKRTVDGKSLHRQHSLLCDVCALRVLSDVSQHQQVEAHEFDAAVMFIHAAPHEIQCVLDVLRTSSCSCMSVRVCIHVMHDCVCVPWRFSGRTSMHACMYWRATTPSACRYANANIHVYTCAHMFVHAWNDFFSLRV